MNLDENEPIFIVARARIGYMRKRWLWIILPATFIAGMAAAPFFIWLIWAKH